MIILHSIINIKSFGRNFIFNNPLLDYYVECSKAKQKTDTASVFCRSVVGGDSPAADGLYRSYAHYALK